MSTDTQEAEHRFVDDVHVELDESSASKQQQEALEELRTAVAASRSALTAGVADIRTAVKAYNVHDIWSAVKRRNEEGQRETAHAQLRRAMETCAKVGADLTHLDALSTEANVKLLQEAAELDQTLCRCEETTAIVPPILEVLTRASLTCCCAGADQPPGLPRNCKLWCGSSKMRKMWRTMQSESKTSYADSCVVKEEASNWRISPLQQQSRPAKTPLR